MDSHTPPPQRAPSLLRPVYDEVVAGKLEVKENVAYGPVETGDEAESLIWSCVTLVRLLTLICSLGVA